MKTDVSFTVASSAAVLLGGVCGGLLYLLRRAAHLLDTVRGAANFVSYDFFAGWKDIALSVGDIIAIFNVSLGVLAILEIAAGLSGLLLAAVCRFKNSPPKLAVLPSILGVLCVLLGAAAAVSLIMSGTAGAFFTFAVVLMQLVLPIIFTIAAIRQIKLIRESQYED